MINQRDNPVEWVLLLEDMDEAKEHLESLICQLAKEGRIDEDEFAVQLGHVFAHLNRNWNARNLEHEIPDHEYDRYSSFPDDLQPVG